MKMLYFLCISLHIYINIYLPYINIKFYKHMNFYENKDINMLINTKKHFIKLGVLKDEHTTYMHNARI